MLKFASLLNSSDPARRTRRGTVAASAASLATDDRSPRSCGVAEVSDRARRELDEQMQRLATLLDRVDSREFDLEAETADIFSVASDCAPSIAESQPEADELDELDELDDSSSAGELGGSASPQCLPCDLAPSTEACHEPVADSSETGSREVDPIRPAVREHMLNTDDEPPTPMVLAWPFAPMVQNPVVVRSEELATTPAIETCLIGYPDGEDIATPPSVHMMFVNASCPDVTTSCVSKPTAATSERRDDVANDGNRVATSNQEDWACDSRRTGVGPESRPAIATRSHLPIMMRTPARKAEPRTRRTGRLQRELSEAAQATIGTAVGQPGQTHSLTMNVLAVLAGLLTLFAIRYFATDSSNLF